MKFLTISISVLLLLSNCKNPENKEVESHSLQKSVSALLSSNDTLFKTFYDKGFLSALDTLNFKGKESPIKLSLIEYYAGSTYTVSQTKLLLATYTGIGRLYSFKLNASDKWQLVTLSEISAKELDTIENNIIDAIKKDQIQLKNNPDSYRVGDIVRYSSKRWNGNKSVSVITLKKPGYSLFDVINNIRSIK